MKDNKSVIRLFIVAILASSLILSPLALDLTLTARFIALAVLLLIAIWFIYRSNKRYGIGFDLVLTSYAGYIFFCVLSFSWALNKSEALFDSSKAVLSLLVFVFTCFSLKQDRTYFITALQKSSVTICLILLLVGLLQYVMLPNTDKISLYSVTGLNGHKNLFASFLFLNVLFLVQACRDLTKIWKVLAILALVSTCVMLIILKTKAVWIGLLVTAGVAASLYLYSRVKRRWKLNLAIAIVLCLLGANLFFLCGLQPVIRKGLAYNASSGHVSIKQDDKGLDQERLVIWDKTYAMIRQHPVFGVGMGNWQIFFPQATLSGLWRAEDLNYTFQRPHNDFLWIISETGLLGFNLFLLFLTSLFLLSIRVLRTKSDQPYLQGPAPILAFVAGYLVISFFDFPRERVEHLVWSNILLGLCYYQVREIQSLRSFFTVRLSKKVYGSLFIVLVFIVTVGALRHKGEYYTQKMLNSRGRLQELIRAGRSAVSFAYTLDPTSMPIAWYLGNAYAGLGDNQRAHHNFLRAFRLNPYNRNVLNDLGSSCALLNELDSAKFFYRQAAQISPRFDEPKLNLVALYINENNFSIADSCNKSLFHDSERRKGYQRMIDAFNK